MICRDTPTYGWMRGSVGQWVGSGHISKYRINLDLIEIIQLFEDLCFIETPPPMDGYMGGWVVQWVNGWG